MVKRFLLAVVGMAMGGLIGLLFGVLGAGGASIFVGGILGALLFVLVIPALAGPRI